MPRCDRWVGGFKAWVARRVMKRAGAGVPSANRITLLRDSDGDGVAGIRSVLLDGLNSPFGMALVGGRLFVAKGDAVLVFPYRTGDTAITAPGTKLVDLPGGPMNHHWTKNLLASADGRKRAIVPDHACGPHTASLGSPRRRQWAPLRSKLYASGAGHITRRW